MKSQGLTPQNACKKPCIIQPLISSLMYQRGGGSKLLADSGVEAASTCRGVPVGLVPRLFLMEEKSPVTFGGQSRLLPLCHDSCDLQWPRPIFENNPVIFAKARAQIFQRERQRKQHKAFEQSGKLYLRLITQAQHRVYKAGKLTLYSHKLLALS